MTLYTFVKLVFIDFLLTKSSTLYFTEQNQSHADNKFERLGYNYFLLHLLHYWNISFWNKSFILRLGWPFYDIQIFCRLLKPICWKAMIGFIVSFELIGTQDCKHTFFSSPRSRGNYGRQDWAWSVILWYK